MKINIIGDLCLQGIDVENFSIDDSIKKIFVSSDLNIANLENPLTESNHGKPYQPTYLKCQPKNNHIYELFDIFSLANNHIMDYGKNGLFDTLGYLKSHNKLFFGANLNLNKSLNAVKLTIKGIKIAFLGFTHWDNAKRKKPGTTPYGRLFRTAVKGLKKEGYFIIVYPHWNYEYIDYPAPDNRRIARKLIDCGVDLIVGSHPHVIQGYEEYKGKYIFHSFGNFIFHSDVFKNMSMIENDPRLHITFILSVNIHDNNDYNFEIIPVYTDDSGLRMLNGTEKEQFDEKMDQISNVLYNNSIYKKLFYTDSSAMIKQTNKVFNKLIADQGLKSLLIRLDRIKKQDVKIFFHSLVRKYL